MKVCRLTLISCSALVFSALMFVTLMLQTRILSPRPQFESLVFKTIEYKMNDPFALSPMQTIALKRLTTQINELVLQSSVLNGVQPLRMFKLVVTKSEEQFSDYFDIGITPDTLESQNAMEHVIMTVATKIDDLKQVGGLPELIRQRRDEFVWISCEPPSLKKISAMRQQIRRVLFLQLCSPMDRSLADHLKTHRIDKYLAENNRLNFARINVQSWKVYEKWHGELWNSNERFKENAGVMHVQVNKDTFVKTAKSAIDVIEAERGLQLL